MKYKGKKIKLVDREWLGKDSFSCVGCVIHDTGASSKYYDKCTEDGFGNMFIYKEKEDKASADSVSQNETVDEQLKYRYRNVALVKGQYNNCGECVISKDNMKNKNDLCNVCGEDNIVVYKNPSEDIAKTADNSLQNRVTLLEHKVKNITHHISKLLIGDT